jgi:predicted chitinase
MQQHIPTAAASASPVAQDCTATVVEKSAPHFLMQNPQVRSQFRHLMQTLNYMSRVVATIFQQVMTELSGAEAEEDRLKAITKIVLVL